MSSESNDIIESLFPSGSCHSCGTQTHKKYALIIYSGGDPRGKQSAEYFECEACSNANKNSFSKFSTIKLPEPISKDLFPTNFSTTDPNEK